MVEKFKILIVEDEKLAGKVLKDNLRKLKYSITLSDSGESAIEIFKKESFDILLLDYKLPGISGEDLFLKIREIDPFIPVIFMTAYSSVDKAVRLLKLGAFNYLTKPLEMDELLHNIKNITEKILLEKENRVLREKLDEKLSFERYIFNSDKMQEVVNISLRVAPSEATVLLTGESGTGKEVFADLIHFNSGRKEKRFVKVNIAAIPETLIESELFGTEKGAYTGATERRKGRFEEADGGTIFLDEIGDLPLTLQVKLLRVIQEKRITRLGSNNPVLIDVRIISATNRELKKLVDEGTFREDLYFRLNVINIELPPLRERKEDLPLLIDFFLKKYSERERKKITSISKEAMTLLVRYNYKGNIRELENIIERGVVLCRGDRLLSNDLPAYMNEESENNFKLNEMVSLPLAEQLNLIEKKIIEQTLKRNRYNQTKTSVALGISESGLRYKLKNLKIDSGRS